MKHLTQSELIEIIRNSKGAMIVGIEALTDSRAKKTGNTFGKIFKQIRTVAFVGAYYERAVNREGGRQGENSINFKSESLPWGEWFILNKIIFHKGEYYLRTQSTPGQRRTQAEKVLSYRNGEGIKLDYDKIKQFLPTSKESEKQQASGLNQTVWIRNYSFNSIKKIRIAGKTFKLVNK